MSDLYPDVRVMVYDAWAYGKECYYNGGGAFRPATVVKWYGQIKTDYKDFTLGPYENLVDVLFDDLPEFYRPQEGISKGHFANFVKIINKGK